LRRIIRGIMKHAYWTVICKTPKCGTTLFFKGSYIGLCEDSDTSIKVTFEPPESVELPCSHCGKTHTYIRIDFAVTQWPYRVEPDAELPI
jgi:hypothetical protein